MRKEIWKAIPENTSYIVSNMGRVKNIRTEMFLKPRPTKNGYMRIHVAINNGKRKDVYVHRLVAELFCHHPVGCDVINHIDNNPQNNRADNLEWVTQRDNVIYAMNQGRVPNFPNAKNVIAISSDNKMLKFRSKHEASLFAKCDSKTMCYRCKHSDILFDGYYWREVI